ncbi:MAG TPA: hypothetical protein VMB74_13600 [Streptosporangiaceae bacterium]|nr:hypothetical protein [Streptosporangiaceae bacterium]
MTTNRLFVVAMAAAAAIAGTAITSCSSGPSAGGPPQRTVFPTSSPTLAGVTDAITVPTDELLNFGIANLANTSNTRVTIEAVKLISPAGPAIREVSYQAYTGRELEAPLGLQGDLPKNCPEHFKPRPIRSLSYAARSSIRGEAVVSFVITKPGHYTMGTMRIDYTSGGHRYRQFYYLPVKITALPAKANPRLVQPTMCAR